ncbi:hypothetical protein D1872_271800 [compost metagenome]
MNNQIRLHFVPPGSPLPIQPAAHDTFPLGSHNIGYGISNMDHLTGIYMIGMKQLFKHRIVIIIFIGLILLGSEYAQAIVQVKLGQHRLIRITNDTNLIFIYNSF